MFSYSFFQVDYDRFAAIDLICWLLQPDPRHRPETAAEVLTHRFLNLPPPLSETAAIDAAAAGGSGKDSSGSSSSSRKRNRMLIRRPKIHLAAATGDLAMLEAELTEKLVDPNLRDNLLHETPLHRAAKENKVKEGRKEGREGGREGGRGLLCRPSFRLRLYYFSSFFAVLVAMLPAAFPQFSPHIEPTKRINPWNQPTS